MSTRTAFLVAVPSTLLVVHGLRHLADVFRDGWHEISEGLWR